LLLAIVPHCNDPPFLSFWTGAAVAVGSDFLTAATVAVAAALETFESSFFSVSSCTDFFGAGVGASDFAGASDTAAPDPSESSPPPQATAAIANNNIKPVNKISGLTVENLIILVIMTINNLSDIPENYFYTGMSIRQIGKACSLYEAEAYQDHFCSYGDLRNCSRITLVTH